MNRPDQAESVAGAEDELTAADLEQLGVALSDADVDAIAEALNPRTRTQWKPIALRAEQEAQFWRQTTMYLGVTFGLTFVALIVAVAL